MALGRGDLIVCMCVWWHACMYVRVAVRDRGIGVDKARQKAEGQAAEQRVAGGNEVQVGEVGGVLEKRPGRGRGHKGGSIKQQKQGAKRKALFKARRAWGRWACVSQAGSPWP